MKHHLGIFLALALAGCAMPPTPPLSAYTYPVPTEKITGVGLTFDHIEVTGAIEFVRFERQQNGKLRLVFRLTNILDIPICFPRPRVEGYEGRLRFYNMDGANYRDSMNSAEPAITEIPEGIAFENGRIPFQRLLPGENILIIRDLEAASIRNWVPGFEDPTAPVRARLEVNDVTSCSAEQIEDGLTHVQWSNLELFNLFDFRSELTPPFRLQ